MKKRALRKDFYMEIRKSLGRFLSIFFIVAMGVAFFSGIRASEPDLRYSGDAYFDRNHLMDLKVMGTLGLTENDVQAIRSLEGVAQAEPGYSADVMVERDGNQKVLHVSSILDSMNQYTVEEGRMPKKDGECLIDQDFIQGSDLKVGDEITLISGTKDPVTDTFTKETFRIVGAGSSPEYISFHRGSSMIGNGEVSGFLAVPKESFVTEAYTECYVSVEGAEEETAFTEEYDQKVEKVAERIESIGERQGALRAEEIRGDAKEELSDAKAELEEGKKKAEKELSDGKAKITDAEAQLQSAKEQLESGKQALEAGRNELLVSQTTVDEAYAQIADGQAQLAQGKAEFEAKEEEFRSQYETGMEQIAAGEKQIAAGRIELEEKKAEYEAGKAGLDQMKITLAELQAALENGMIPEEQIPQTEVQIAALQKTIAQLEPQLAQAADQIAQAEQVIVQKEQELAAARTQLEEGKTAIEAARGQLTEAENELYAGEAQAAEGQRQIDAGWEAIHAGEAELAAGENEIAVNEKKLAEAKEAYENGKKEAEAEIKDGENKIKDAEQKIADIEDAKWYVNDRSTLSDYVGYGDNADRMRAIGEVFPILFFIVAALISLTTMTRMVEEQRTQIGTLKALGYGKFSIAGKYLNYALMATIGGSIFGVLFGEKVFPYIIVTAYKIIYIHMPDIVIPYHWGYAAMATGAAVVCTSAATLLACYKELASQPAVLMRPPAPKQGKRVFLERITFIWSRLSFIWKSTIRNLIRYKKRFFMTVFGIGGCMALMIVGFGLRDSIFDVGRIQYQELNLYDGMIILNTDADEKDKESLEQYLQGEKEISQASEGYLKKTNVEKGKIKKDVYLYVPEDLEKNQEFLVYRDRKTQETFELGERDVILTEKMAKTLEVKKGDTITVKGENGDKKELTITNVCENYMEHYLYVSPEIYKEMFGALPKANNIYFKMKEFDEKKLKEIGEKVLEERATLNVSYAYNVEEQMDEMLESLDIVIIVLIISAGLLAFVVLYNLNNININERKRELATIKVLGFYDNEVSAYVYRENILLTLIGTVVGVILGSILHRFVITTVEIDTVMFARTIKGFSFLYSALLTCGFSVFVNCVMYFKLKKINMVESLKSVE